MSGASGFSKISEVLTDEEDDRQALWQLSRSRFQKAQEGYATRGAGLESLKLFEDAEHALAPLLEASGLTGLRERELEAVLKGRLHRAVITAHLEELADRWDRVKSLVEDVLQFDFSNCHARWLRGLSLLHGLQQRADARNEMRRAVDCARQQKKTHEVEQWEAEIEATFSGEAETAPAAPPAAAPAPASAPSVASPGTQTAATEPADAVRPRATARKPSATLKGGFFNKASEKSAKQRASEANTAEAAIGPSTGAACATSSASSASSRRESGLEEDLRALRERHRQRESELLDEVQALKDRVSQDRLRREDWLGELSGVLDTLGSEIVEGLEPEDEEQAANSEEVLRSLVGQASDAKDHSAADRTWAESAHQRYMDITTEVATLREMSSREMKERQDGARARTSEVKDLTKRFGELKGATKALRDGLRLLLGPGAGSAEATAEADSVRIAEQAREFKALPASAKLGALFDDAAVLWILIFTVVFGMLVALGLSVEVFGGRRCRLACGR